VVTGRRVREVIG
jgi:hypothetical protein